MINDTISKYLNEAVRNEKDKSDPLVFIWQDAKGDRMLAHMFLQDSADLHDYDADTVLRAKGFYEGTLVPVKAGWSTSGGKLWIQISHHSKFKK